MHVLISVLHRPIKPTGVCRHAANLARCLVDLETIGRVSLVIGAWQLAYYQQAFDLKSDQISLIVIDLKNTAIARNFWYVFGLPRLARRVNADIVHLSFPLPFIRALFPCPVVATLHDFYPYEKPENFGYPQVLFNQFFLKQCIHQSNGLTCVSEQTLKALKQFFPKVEKIKSANVIYNYVDFTDIQPQSPAIEGLKNQPQFLLSIAQHRKNKNLDLLIHADHNLLNHQVLPDDAQLLLVGANGPETERLLQLIQDLSLHQQVILTSTLTDQELSWLYQQAMVLVVPSSVEGFCFPAVEANYFSCPVVCSDLPIFRELALSHCTYFSLCGNPVENLAAAIQQAISTPYSKKNNPDLRFSKSSAASQYLDFYSLVSKNLPQLVQI